MNKIKDILRRLLKNEDLTRQLVIIAALASSFTLIIASIINFILKLPVELIYPNIVGIVFFLTCALFFMYALNPRIYLIFKWIFTFGAVFYLDYIWFVNFGSMGSGMFAQMILLALLLLIWDKTGKIVVIILFYTNAVGLMLIELNYPELFGVYEDRNTRIIDVYTVYYLYGIILIATIIVISNRYYKEKEKAIQSDMLKSAFLANLSHEIRTPMNAIMGFSDLLENVENIEKRKRFIELINHNSLSLLRIIDDIIEISKIESGEYEVVKQRIEVKNMFEKLGEAFQLDIKRYGKDQLKLTTTIDPPGLTIVCDRFKLQQVLSAFLSNAVKFSSEGKIEMKCILKKSKVQFSVKDQGIGIEDEYHEKIFEKFFKLDNTDTRLKGTGIGLSVAMDLIEILDGEIWFESTFGKGSEFFITIPY